MNTFASLVYHVIFRTADGAPLLAPSHEQELCRYVNGMVRNRRGILFEASAMPDHVHLLLSIRPSIAVADVVRDIKASSSKQLNENSSRRGWFRWEPGYGLFSVSESEVPRVSRFIRRQQQFHQKSTSEEEIASLVEKHGFEYDATASEHQRHTYAWSRVHVVFSTKLRMQIIPEALEKDLYQSFGRLASGHRSELIEVGGIADHVHLVLAPHQSVPIADVLRTIKNESTYWMRDHLGDEVFFSWQRGYGAFSVSLSRLPTVREYIRQQKEHHRTTSTEDEFRNLLTEHGFDPDRS